MKLFTTEQIREIDLYTIENEPIKSVDLMERAAGALFKWFQANINRSSNICIFTGPGNNGGDGLALARMLSQEEYRVEVFNIRLGSKYSDDWKINRERLKAADLRFTEVQLIEEMPLIDSDCVIVDAIFGSGLTRGLSGFAAEVLNYLNSSVARKIAIDMPSGLAGEDNTGHKPESIFKADITLSLQFPKLSFMFAENSVYVGDVRIIPIGLHPRIIREKETSYGITDRNFAAGIIKLPGTFDHKGVNGHGLLASGSCGKAGASVLAARAAMRTGIGLLTVHTPKPMADILHLSVPEAMVQCDQSDVLISDIADPGRFDAVGIGPGIGTKPNTVKAMEKLLDEYKGPIVIDADALNILGANRKLLGMLPESVVLTPHPGEFSRLAGDCKSGFEMLKRQSLLSSETGAVILLKGARTSVSLPDGRIWFNSTGNPGMATAGSGDVLTGMILALLAKGYSAADAAILGAYLHGLSGDIAIENSAPESLIASDIIDNIGQSYLRTRKE